MNLRRTLFWFLDYLKGSPLKKAKDYSYEIMDSEDRALVSELNSAQLNKLLQHASKTTGYYRNSDYKTLQDFPVVNKNIIRDNLDAFFSSKSKKSNCKVVTTSGSTGTPFSVYQNSEKVRKVQADNIYFSEKSKYSVGDFLAYIKFWPKHVTFKMRLSLYLKNFSAWSILEFSDTTITKLLRELNQRKTISLLTYPSALDQLCKHIDQLDENPIKFKTKSIITVSESLKESTRKATSRYFGVTPLGRYSNNESGIIAQQYASNDTRYRINDSSYIIEILSLDNDDEVAHGQPGRIVITDLFSFATPLIRYDTGDIGIMEIDNNGVPYFTEILGRKIDQLYDTSGNLISSHLSTRLMDFGDFKQFQLVQKSKIEYHFNMNTEHPVNESDAADYFKTYFGENAVIKFNYVTEIPVLSSGKRREVVNEYYTS